MTNKAVIPEDNQDFDEGGVLAWFTKNHVAANLLMVIILAMGILTLGTDKILPSSWSLSRLVPSSINIEVMPEIDPGSISVTVPYRGATPAEVEDGVVLRIEEAVDGIEGIDRIQSTAVEGRATVVISIDDGIDKREVLDEIKSAVDRIDTFPAEIEEPIVSDTVIQRQVITVAIHGEVDHATLKHSADRIRDELQALPDITTVDIAGIRRPEISVEVSDEALERWHLSFDAVVAAVRRHSLDLPAGSIDTAGGEILLRTVGQKYTGTELEQIPVISRPDGSVLRLGEIATVVDGFEDTDLFARFNGRPSAFLRVQRIGDEGALDIARVVKEYVEVKRPEMPPGLEIDTWEDWSKILRQRLELLLRNAAIGLTLVFLSLALFLAPKLAFWTTMGIPISFLGAFFFMPFLDVSINMISLFAFIVSLGIVVDDAIVVGENVFAKIESGMTPERAAIEGVREMAAPVTFAIITTVVAFLPLAFAGGNVGQLMRNIPLVVITVLLISLVEALLILPSHLASAGEHPVEHGPLAWLGAVRTRAQSLLQRFIDGVYARHLDRAIRHRYLTVSVAIGCLIVISGLFRGGFIEFIYMPDVDADNVVAAIEVELGTPSDELEAVVAAIEAAGLEAIEEIEAETGNDVLRNVATVIGQQPFSSRRGGLQSEGRGAANIAEVNLELVDSELRGIEAKAIERLWKEKMPVLAGIRNLSLSASIFSAGAAIDLELVHADEETLSAAVAAFKAEIATFPGVSEISDSDSGGNVELELGLTSTGLASGLSLEELGRQVRAAFYGAEAQRIQRGRDDVRVMVRLPEDRRQSLADLENLTIRLSSGDQLPLSTVATIDRGRGPATISRNDRRRVTSVTAEVDPTVANANEINRAIRSTVLPAMLERFEGLDYGFEGEQREQAETLESLWRNFLMALIAMYALLAVPFRSYIQPLIVMSAIPFGFIGAVLGHLIMGLDLSMLSMFGVVALTGVVVNDSLIMIDLINRSIAKGMGLEQALRESGTRRFRAILLTTMTTFLGLTPMILETSVQAKFLIPMAVSLGFGVISATAITLLLVPALYRIVEDIRGIGQRQDAAIEADEPQESEVLASESA